MPLRLRLALAIAAGCHAILILAARYRLSYDAYTHMFFADHYLNNWGTLWDERWYAGFTVVSYPPLVHQVMAMLAGFIGVDAAFALVLFAILAVLPAAVYAFARVFVESASAGNAAIGAAVLPSVYLTAHVFGQLPTLAALVLALCALASFARYLRSGNRIIGALCVALLATMVAAHHATLLFLPWGILAVAGHILINKELNLRILGLRIIVILLPSALVCFGVIWPFWIWGLTQGMQTPIDHLSRHNFLDDPAAIALFFAPMYGVLVVVIPYAISNLRHRALAALASVFLALAILGLGGTTPLPHLLFGSNWEWLTYDRFTLWATVILLVFFGRLVTVFQHHRFTWFSWLANRVVFLRGIAVRRAGSRALSGVGLVLLASTAFGAALFPVWFPTQPLQIDMRPIVKFLQTKDHADWRYLTFGFGDQYAALSLATTATTIDGSYHTARQLPELRASGIGQIDSIFWSDKGLGALDPILQNAAQYSVRWGFINRSDYIPVLQRHGWAYNQMLANGVAVWENPNPGNVITQKSETVSDPLQVFAWQLFPLTALALAGILALVAVRPVRARMRQGLLRFHSLMVGLLPLGLSFWLYKDLIPIPYPRIYFTYTDMSLFISDGLIIGAVIAWALSRLITEPVHSATTPLRLNGFQPVIWLTRLLVCLCAVATISALWAVDARLALATSAHLWLLFAFYYSLKDNPVPLSVLFCGASVAILIQAGIGYVEVIQQSTAFLVSQSMKWPGLIDPAIHGASVVQLTDGTRWLRAYGSLPHPNILGGLSSIVLIPPAGWLLIRNRLRLPAVVVIILGITVIFLAFSRSAWLGSIAAAIVLLWHHRIFTRRRLLALVLVAIPVLLAIAIPFSRQVYTRVAGLGVPTEQQSIQVRMWMTEHALMMIGEHPLAGVGAGNFVVELVNRNPGVFMLEPVHNVPLLVASELGIPGVALLIAISTVLAIGMLKASHPQAIIASMMIACLACTAAFDHFLWTIAPGRDLLWLVLGIWAGWQIVPTPLTQHASILQIE